MFSQRVGGVGECKAAGAVRVACVLVKSHSLYTFKRFGSIVMYPKGVPLRLYTTL